MNSVHIVFSELRDVYEYVSGEQPQENFAYLCLETSCFFLYSEFENNEEELPEDIHDSSKYIEIPNKNELQLGRDLAINFSADMLPEILDEVYEIFRARGAYSRFKNLLEKYNNLQQWYVYEENEIVSALQQWCSDNKILILDK